MRRARDQHMENKTKHTHTRRPPECKSARTKTRPPTAIIFCSAKRSYVPICTLAVCFLARGQKKESMGNQSYNYYVDKRFFICMGGGTIFFSCQNVQNKNACYHGRKNAHNTLEKGARKSWANTILSCLHDKPFHQPPPLSFLTSYPHAPGQKK